MKKLLTTLALLGTMLTGAWAQNTEADFTYTPACLGEATVLTSTSTVHPLDSIVIFAWDLDGDLSFDDAIGEQITYTFPGPALDHNVGLKITTKFNITKSVYYQVQISDVITNFDWANTCFGDVTSFTSLAQVTNDIIVDWTWDFGDGLASKEENPDYTFKDWTLYMVSLTVVTQNGCSDNITLPVLVNPVPSVSLSFSFDPVDPGAAVPEFSFYEGEVLQVTANILGTYDNVVWSDGQTGLTANFTTAGNYSVTVTDKNGCLASAFFVIHTTLLNDLEPTTVITPNNDGQNDVWYIKPVILPGESYEVAIYNRWGDEVYSNASYANDWNGTYEGNALPEGAYYYVVKNNNRSEEVKKGAINIVVR
ncbi:MAG TPA: gliding motility-associated C-terminal domain-containing protein [Bacteroidales bacterium]|nr:gliding motility-associated C-terminal domain-containing protein [Bacteroidales bacterium]